VAPLCAEISEWQKKVKTGTHRLTSHIRRSEFADRGDGMAWANKGCKERPRIEITVQLQRGYYKSLGPRL
jgi:hypothetical protein